MVPFPHSDMIVSHCFRGVSAAFRENHQGWNCISLESAETSRLAGILARGIDNNQSVGLGMFFRQNTSNVQVGCKQKQWSARFILYTNIPCPSRYSMPHSVPHVVRSSWNSILKTVRSLVPSMGARVVAHLRSLWYVNILIFEFARSHPSRRAVETTAAAICLARVGDRVLSLRRLQPKLHRRACPESFRPFRLSAHDDNTGGI